MVGHYRFAELAHHHAVVASGRKGYLVGVEAGYRTPMKFTRSLPARASASEACRRVS